MIRHENLVYTPTKLAKNLFEKKKNKKVGKNLLSPNMTASIFLTFPAACRTVEMAEPLKRYYAREILTLPISLSLSLSASLSVHSHKSPDSKQWCARICGHYTESLNETEQEK
jgi:hypothetical protein